MRQYISRTYNDIIGTWIFLPMLATIAPLAIQSCMDAMGPMDLSARLPT